MKKPIITIILLAVLISGIVAFFLFLKPSKEAPQVSLPKPLPVPPLEIPSPIEATTTEGKPETSPPPKATEEGPPTPPREPQEFIVDIYSFTDWRPLSLTIRAGDTITFINHDDTLHWPGADPHPTHTSLPAFDALGGLSKEQSYSHTFRKAGTYGHHEHLLDDPPQLGIITVLPR